MEITGLGWCGTRTDHAGELAHFYEHVLGLRLVHTEPDFWVFELPDGRHVEVFGELRRAGVELLGEPGPSWQHFRGPDGNVYELVAD